MSDAVTTVTMDESPDRLLTDRGVQGVLGQPVDRIEGPLKVTGRAEYSNDGRPENLAYGWVLTSEIALGRIRTLDASAARSAPGVIAVITEHPLFPTDAAGSDPRPPRRLPEIANYGQPIGFIVAETLEAARAVARLVRVDYQSRKGRYEMQGHLDAAEAEPKGALIPDIRRSDIEAAMAQAAVAFDRTYTTPHHFPAAMEPHATIAEWADGKLVLHSSLQILKTALPTIAAALEIDAADVRIVARYVGGGFGGKTGVGPEVILAAIAARETGRPVKVALSRRQTAHLVHHRGDTVQRIRIGCDEAGRIAAMGHDSITSQKASRSFIEPVALGSIAMYAGEARSFTQAKLALDLPAAGAVRAPGEAVGTLALECAMDEMAEQLGLDPIAFRKLNEPSQDPTRNAPFSTRRLIDCYDEGARRFGWSRRNPTPGQVMEGEWLIGLGMAGASRVNFLVESDARVTLQPDGRALIEADMTDIGTGAYTILAQIAAEMLGLPIEQVDVRLGDTDFPRSAGSGGSFGAASSGSSVAIACEDIVKALAVRMGVSAAELVLKDGQAIAQNRQVAFADLLGGASIRAEGRIKPGRNSRTFSQAAHGAQFAEVAVNAVTGEVRVRRMLAVFDCGRILNRKTARSQAIGGMIWGLSAALHEEAVADTRTGAFVTRDLAEYHVPVNADIGRIEAHFIEEPDRHANPIGAKGLGELGNAGAGAAVVNAIHNACGARIYDFPVTLDKLLPHLPPV